MTRHDRNGELRRAVGSVSGRESGAALPYTLFTLVLLSLMVTGGFILAWAELRSSQAFGAGVRAFYVSDGGLQQALATGSGTPPPVQSFRIGAGNSQVTSTRLLSLGHGASLYHMSSTGTVAGPRASIFRRAIEVIALAGEPPLFPAAVTSSTGLAGGLANGIISGFDQVSVCSGRYGGPVAAVAAPTAAPLTIGPGLRLTGAPTVDRLGPGVSLRHATGLSWTDLTAAHGPDRDASIPPDAWPPRPPQGSSQWPVIDLHAPAARLDAGHSGQGTVIARGDLQLDGGFGWRGLILVGGVLRVRGDVRLDGAFAAGLDSAVVSGPAVDLGSGQVDIAFDACSAEAAARSIAPRPAAQPGTWREHM